MVNVRPEQRAEWRAEAERVRLGSCCFLAGQPGHGPGEHRAFYYLRILSLLDALEEVEEFKETYHEQWMANARLLDQIQALIKDAKRSVHGRLGLADDIQRIMDAD